MESPAGIGAGTAAGEAVEPQERTGSETQEKAHATGLTKAGPKAAVTMWRGSLLVLALAQDEPWRTELGLHKTGQEQRRAAHWLADLDQAINFDLDTLATDHALRRSQISQAGWTETHAKWLTRSHCAYQREGSTAPGAHVQRRCATARPPWLRRSASRGPRRCATRANPPGSDDTRCTRRTSSN